MTGELSYHVLFFLFCGLFYLAMKISFSSVQKAEVKDERGFIVDKDKSVIRVPWFISMKK